MEAFREEDGELRGLRSRSLSLSLSRGLSGVEDEGLREEREEECFFLSGSSSFLRRLEWGLVEGIA